MRFLKFSVFALFAVVFLCSTTTNMGWIEGTVLSLGGDPLPNAAVRIVDTERGQAVNSKGHFRFSIRPGKHNLEISHIGFETEVISIVVSAGQTLLRNVVLEPAAPELMNVYRVTGNQIESDKPIKHSETLYTDDNFDEEDTELLEQISRNPGVTLHQGQLSIRGLKPTTTQIQVDGIPVSSPLDGQAVQLATNAVQGAEIMVGGADAEHGQFQGGVINLRTKEGTDRFRGSFRYSTDDYGAPDKTYTNFDQFSLGFGGPLVPGRLRYYLSFQGTWQDTHLRTEERRSTTSFLDFIQVKDRQRNNAQGQAKLTWKASPTQKLSLEYLGNEQKWDSYQHNFNRVGFVETETDTAFDTGEVVTRYGDFAEEAKGPNWVFYDGPAHTPNYTSSFNQLKLIYNHQVFDSSLLTVKISKHGFVNRETVNDQEAWQYETESPWRNAIHGESHPYFATHGDVPIYAERDTDVFTTKADWSSSWGAHQMKAGVNVSGNTFSVRSLLFPSRLNADGQYGLVRSEFTARNWEASTFVQDRWEHEGMVVNLGLRYDLLNVGDQLGPDEVQNRMRGAVSPRVGFAYPVTDRDVFSFHYGRYDQTPSRQAIFENRSNFVTVRGNPDLKNETTVAYQAALQHLFSPTVFGQFSLYFRDIFGQLSVERVQSENTPGDIN
ncbi:MAG: TonB-dependent receptor, partial [Candidatus Eisenbacteria bacterium]|nr:TonB-dependent receptor [Candidatus Eisenbacteria bacterium]